MPFNKITSEEAHRILGTYAPQNNSFIGVTLNFPPKMYVHFKGNKQVFQWQDIPPSMQIQWTLDYIEKVYSPLFWEMIFSFEISENNKLHTHILGYIGNDYPSYNLLQTRGQVSCNVYANKYIKKKHMITSNYIHLIQEPYSWLTYLLKDTERNPFYIYHYDSIIKVKNNGAY